MEWYLDALKKYFVFSGRARRTEYWMFTLITTCFGVVAAVLDNVLGIAMQGLFYGPLYIVYSFGTFIPGIAVSVRRLHDVEKSGWFLLLPYGILFAGLGLTVINEQPTIMAVFGIGSVIASIWLTVQFCKDSMAGRNKYGVNPKEDGVTEITSLAGFVNPAETSRGIDIGLTTDTSNKTANAENWKSLIDTIEKTGKTSEALQKLKSEYPHQVQLMFYILFHGRYTDVRQLYSLPFFFDYQVLSAATKFHAGYIINDPLLATFGLDNYKPVYQAMPDGRVVRQSNMIVDQSIVTACSFLKGKKLTDMVELSQMAYDAIFTVYKWPLVCYFFSLPLLEDICKSNLSVDIPAFEISLLTATENFLIEMYDQLKEGETISEERVTEKIMGYFE